MRLLLWDANAQVKRYYKEIGADTVAALFAAVPMSAMTGTFIGYAETTAILRRKYNRGEISRAEFASARALLESEVLDSLDFILLSIEDEDVLEGIALSDKHNINSTDASILAAYLGFARSLPPEDLPCVLVAADQRLLRAALVEGLDALNPEIFAAADVAAFLAGAP